MQGCKPEGGDILYGCADINSSGGLKAIYICHKDDITVEDADGDSSEITNLEFAEDGSVIEIEFNDRDGVTTFNESFSIDPAGAVANTITLAVEIPTMSKQNRKNLSPLLRPQNELVAFIALASGQFMKLGASFGLRAGDTTGASGASRSDKNMFNVTFTGEEDALSLFLSVLAWGDVMNNANGVIPVVPVIITQPANTSVVDGEDAVFTVETDNLDGPYTYDWYFDGILQDGFDSILTLESVTIADTGKEVYCEVSNPAGTTTSDVATLTVTAS